VELMQELLESSWLGVGSRYRGGLVVVCALTETNSVIKGCSAAAAQRSHCHELSVLGRISTAGKVTRRGLPMRRGIVDIQVKLRFNVRRRVPPAGSRGTAPCVHATARGIARLLHLLQLSVGVYEEYVI